MRCARRAAAAVLATCLAVSAMGSATVAAAAPGAQASRYASIVVDADTGAVLYERNADLVRHPASLTKIMTLYLVFEALASKKLKLTDELPVSAHAAGRDPSRLNLAPGSRLKVEDAIRAMATKSANDASVVLAEALSKGSEKRFAEAMTAKGKAMGLKNTVFRNASGLPDDGHVSTARDLAVLCRAVARDFPEQYRYFSTNSFEFRGVRYPNQNRFLRTYYGADGIKTGFVNASGHNLAASAVRGGKRLIAVVLGGDTQAWTREHATRLLDVSYAKIDPSMVMVASNAAAAPPTADAAAAPSASPAPTAAPAAAPAVPPGTPILSAAPVPSATALPLPNATANLLAYAGSRAASAPKPAPAARTGQAPAGGTPPTAPSTATGSAPAASPAQAVASARPQPLSGGVPVAPQAAARSESSTPIRSIEPAPGARPTESAPAATAEAPATAAAPPQARPEPEDEDEVERQLVARTGRDDLPTTPPAAASAAAPVAKAPAAPTAPPTGAPAPEPAPRAEATSKPAPSPEARAEDPDPALSPREGGDWSVQVGLFRDATTARRRGEEARQQMPLDLRGADLVVAKAQDGVHVTSRLGRLSEQQARAACSHLQRGRVPCVVVPPGRPLVVATN